MIQTALIPVAAYCRKSPDNDEGRLDRSIDEQKQAILKYCKEKGYHVTEWYIDQDWSGDDPRRPQFLRLLSDTTSPTCAFSRIVVWDQSRFSRLDPEQMTLHTIQLKDHGITLESVCEGVLIDPENDHDVGGQILRYFRQYSAHQKLKDASKDSSRGILNALKNGRVGGPVPYGCKKRPDGLLEIGESEEVEVVRWIYETLDTTNISRTALCRELNRREISSPEGGRWLLATLTPLILNPIYKGRRQFGKHHFSKHNHIIGAEQIVPVKHSEKRKKVRDPSGGILLENPGYVGDPIVKPEQWERVTSKILSQQHEGKRGPRSNALALSGFLRCGLCGETLCSGGRAHPQYRCSSCRQRDRRDKPHFDYVLGAKKIHKAIIDKILSNLTEQGIAAIRETIIRKLSSKQKTDAKQDAQIASRLKVAEKKLATLKRNMMYADDVSLMADFRKEIKAQEDDISALKAAQAATKQLSGASAKTIRDVADRTVEWLSNIRQDLLSGQSEKLRQIMESLAQKILITPVREEINGRGKVTVERIDIVLHQPETITAQRRDQFWYQYP